MKIIEIQHEKDAPSPHVTFLGDTPEGAALAFTAKFGQPAETVYQLGRRVFIPLTIQPDQFWRAMRNGV